ncbi:hypothetical protein Tsubulata_049343, partial [Turnera subulata]
MGYPSLGCFLSRRYHVRIVNNLNSNILDLHCKSGDNDLREQDISKNSDFGFSFCKNYWGTTLFWCNFNWGDNHGGGYHIWWDKQEGYTECPCPHYHCIWSARDDGLYLKETTISTNKKCPRMMSSVSLFAPTTGGRHSFGAIFVGVTIMVGVTMFGGKLKAMMLGTLALMTSALGQREMMVSI